MVALQMLESRSADELLAMVADTETELAKATKALASKDSPAGAELRARHRAVVAGVATLEHIAHTEQQLAAATAALEAKRAAAATKPAAAEPPAVKPAVSMLTTNATQSPASRRRHGPASPWRRSPAGAALAGSRWLRCTAATTESADNALERNVPDECTLATGAI